MKHGFIYILLLCEIMKQLANGSSISKAVMVECGRIKYILKFIKTLFVNLILVLVCTRPQIHFRIQLHHRVTSVQQRFSFNLTTSTCMAEGCRFAIAIAALWFGNGIFRKTNGGVGHQTENIPRLFMAQIEEFRTQQREGLRSLQAQIDGKATKKSNKLKRQMEQIKETAH